MLCSPYRARSVAPLCDVQLPKASEEVDDYNLAGEYDEMREETTRMSVSTVAAPVPQDFPNMTAGADAGWHLLCLAEQVNAPITGADYQALLEVCKAALLICAAFMQAACKSVW